MRQEQADIGSVYDAMVGGLRRRNSSGLRMTAMIDVIFLLLTFFILTAKFRVPEQFLGVVLAAANSSEQSFGVVEPLVINISESKGDCVVGIGFGGGGGSVVIESEHIDAGLAAFANELAGVLRSQRRTAGDPIEIECGDDVKWDYLVKIYDVLCGMGVNDITFDMTECMHL